MAELPMLALPTEQTIVEVTKEEGPTMACLPMIEAMVEALLVAKLLTDEADGETMDEATREVASKVAQVHTKQLELLQWCHLM